MVRQFLSASTTTNIKGIAILLVILSHIGDGGFHHRIFVPLGGFGVAVFLILSGYGLVESYKKNGLEDFFKKRLTRLLVPYILWMLIYIMLMSCLHQQILVSDLRYWFVEYICIWYLVFFLALNYAPHFRWTIFGLAAIASFWFLPCLQAQQSLSFIIGIAISENKYRLKDIDNKKLYQLSILFVMVGIFAFVTKQLMAMHLPDVSGSGIMVVANVNDDDYLRKFVQIVTKVPIALAIIIVAQIKADVVKIMSIGTIAYELYLVHMPFYYMIDSNYLRLIIFVLFVSLLAIALGWCNKIVTHFIMK